MTRSPHRLLALGLAGVLALAAAPAEARDHHRRGGGNVAGAIIGGLALGAVGGALLAPRSYSYGGGYGYGGSPYYAPPAPVYAAPPAYGYYTPPPVVAYDPYSGARAYAPPAYYAPPPPPRYYEPAAPGVVYEYRW